MASGTDTKPIAIPSCHEVWYKAMKDLSSAAWVSVILLWYYMPKDTYMYKVIAFGAVLGAGIVPAFILWKKYDENLGTPNLAIRQRTGTQLFVDIGWQMTMFGLSAFVVRIMIEKPSIFFVESNSGMIILFLIHAVALVVFLVFMKINSAKEGIE